MSADAYYTPQGGLPGQTQLINDRAIVTEAYTVIPRGVMSDIVLSRFPEWTKTQAWVLNRPVAGGSTTFFQAIVQVEPGGGAEKPEPQPEVESFLFVTQGELTVTTGGRTETLGEGGFGFLPAGVDWSAHNNGDKIASFSWIRKRFEPIEGHTLQAQFGNEQDLPRDPMPHTDEAWATTRMLDPQDIAYDMHVNIVSMRPGASIPFAETHVMEHGLLVLEGKAVYHLNGDWVEVQAGDYLSLRAFCPQACYAGGPETFRYLLYKDVNRQIML